MATYTPNYQLHQWVGSDKFLRTDFNQDFKRIDTALGQKADKTQTANLQTQINAKADEASVDSRFSAVDSRLTTLNAALTTQQNRTYFKAGTYTGNGAASQQISLGFEPTAVIVERIDGERRFNGSVTIAGMAVRGRPLVYPSADSGTVTALETNSRGFTVYYKSLDVHLNSKGNTYLYLAFK